MYIIPFTEVHEGFLKYPCLLPVYDQESPRGIREMCSKQVTSLHSGGIFLMIRMTRKIFSAALLLLVAGRVQGGKIEKGFERLNLFDYFLAREYFIQALKIDGAAAGYGLSIIFGLNNNPFYQLDSARKYILLADSIFKHLPEKKIREYNSFGVNAAAILTQKDSLCLKAYDRAVAVQTEASWNRYISDYPFCRQLQDAEVQRNAIAFLDARMANTSAAFRLFMNKYPNAEDFSNAKDLFELREYQEETENHSLNAYEKFITGHPESPYRKDAERMIFQMTTRKNTIEEYRAFIKRYPDNHYVPQAWHAIYRTYMKEYSKEQLQKFKNEFPGYPYKQELEEDFRIQTAFLLPWRSNGKWGYTDDNGNIFIQPSFEEAGMFSEAVAPVMINGKYGYIDKKGQEVIPFMFEDAEMFHGNFAIVKMNGKYGLINHSGKFILDPLYEDISEPADEICVAVKDDKAAYFSIAGKEITPFQFDVAGDFKNGFAIVSTDDAFGLILRSGQYAIEPEYSELIAVNDEVLRASRAGKWGLISRKNKIILPFDYDLVGEFQNGLALVVKNGKFGYTDTDGHLRIPVIYRYSENMITTSAFRKGYAHIRLKGKSLLLDTLGHPFVLPGFDDYGIPSEGKVAVKKSGKWGYTDLTGKLLIPCRFDAAFPFEFGFAKIRLLRKSGIIDSTGARVIATVYDDVHFDKGVFIVISEGRTGLLESSGGLIFPCEYEGYEWLSDRLIMLFAGDERQYYNTETHKAFGFK